MRTYANGQLGEGDQCHAPQENEEAQDQSQATALSRMLQWSRQTRDERLILALGISALVCLMGFLASCVLRQPSMFFFLATTGQLVLLGLLMGGRAVGVIVRFHFAHRKR